MALQGDFIVPHCAQAGLRMKAYLRNTLRVGESVPPDAREKGMGVELRVFCNGSLVHHDLEFAHVPLDGIKEISETTCAALKGSHDGLLVVARCSLESATNGYFAQEHQLMFERAGSSAFGTVLYDQIPVMPKGRQPTPIILLAPKAWISSSLNTFIAFASTSGQLESGAQARPLTVKMLDAEGNTLHSGEYPMFDNTTFLMNVREMVGGKLAAGNAPSFLTVTARGGAGAYAIMAFMVNERTGNVALEHSLSPHYYVSGDLRRVREEALRFPPI